MQFTTSRAIAKPAQYGAHRARVGAGQLERQSNQFIVALGYVVEHQVFQHPQVVLQQLVVGVQARAGRGVDARCVDAYQQCLMGGQQGNRLRCESGERLPALARRAQCAHQQALRHVGQRSRDMARFYERATVNAMHHPARAEIRLQRQRTDGWRAHGVMQRRIGVGAGVGRQRNAADVDRAIRAQAEMRLLCIRRVARKHSGRFVNRRRNIPDFLHGAATASLP